MTFQTSKRIIHTYYCYYYFTTAAQTVSVEETITNDISSAGNTTMSSSIPATVVSIPSPSTHVAPLPRPNASVVVTVSSAIGVEIVLTSSLSAVVTPVVVANKTANLIKGISALEGNNLIVHVVEWLYCVFIAKCNFVYVALRLCPFEIFAL